MKIINLAQNTQEWLEFRRSRLGASDIGILVMGSKNEIESLLEAKLTGKEKFVTKDMQRGKDLEGEARDWFNAQYGFNCQPLVAVHEEHDWLMASFDGIDDLKWTIIEIKCPRENKLEENPSYARWVWQVQAQLAVSGYEEGLLMAYGNGFTTIKTIKRDEFMIERLLEEGAKFMKKLEKGDVPKLLDSIEDESTMSLTDEYIKVSEQLKALTLRQDEIKEILISRNDGRDFRCGAVTVQRIERQGAINYKSIPELKGRDLEPYRNAPSVYWTIKI